ncbi:MAG TPA: ribosome biogenesis GTP-binding protein YihA/YsxC [Catalimonadaceae bacterium]|nr:ribosome biogenesis GTP-binding protein YihA/YsxC [Catalimonadaceae bacterium]
MKYQFLKSSAEWQQCPPDTFPEIALIGRSNVGKSSLINALLQAKGVAKTSATPGKTQVINHFLIEDSWYLVDLPGYGYARVSQTERAKWSKMVQGYLLNRKNLVLLMLLIDSRIPPQKSDIEFTRFAGKNGLPLILVFTKADKQSALKTKATVQQFSEQMLELWEALPQIVITSATNGLGRDELIDQISAALDASTEIE